MTYKELRDRTLRRVGEDPASPKYHTDAEAGVAINRAQEMFALLTFCLEGSGTLNVAANTPFVHAEPTLARWIAPLRVRNASGARLEARTLPEFAALDPLWRTRPAAATEYCCAGHDLLIFNPVAAAPFSVDVLHARGPLSLTLDADIPEIPEDHHADLIDYAVVHLRLKEGGQELADELPRLKEFFAGASRMAAYVRERSKRLFYDSLPPERWYSLTTEKHRWKLTLPGGMEAASGR